MKSDPFIAVLYVKNLGDADGFVGFVLAVVSDVTDDGLKCSDVTVIGLPNVMPPRIDSACDISWKDIALWAPMIPAPTGKRAAIIADTDSREMLHHLFESVGQELQDRSQPGLS